VNEKKRLAGLPVASELHDEERSWCEAALLLLVAGGEPTPIRRRGLRQQ